VVAALPLLASSYQFCRVDAKLADETDGDHFFLGFPSYWNVLAFYAIVLDASPAAVAVALVVFSVLVFVPVRYLYPSRMTTLRTTTLVFSAVWAATYVVLLLQFPDPHPAVVAVSLAYLVYYNGLSVWLTVTGARARRRSAEPVERAGEV
jgi:phosphatidylcholine synthase